MSNYKNFIQDFPERCAEILKEYRNHARKNGREVTHMFAIASCAITIPFERLRKPSDGAEHPSGDKKKYEKAAGQFDNLCGKYFLGSCLWKDASKSWKTGQVKREDTAHETESWITDSKSLTKDMKVKEVLEHIRNALAHGSIFTLPDNIDQIKNIIFLSKIMNGRSFSGNYKMLMVSAEDFYEFIVKWVSFLKHELKIPSEID